MAWRLTHSAEDTERAVEFYPDLDLWLAYHPGPEWFTGSAQVIWGMAQVALGDAQKALGKRLLGVRLNHEFRATSYPATNITPMRSRAAEWEGLLERIRAGENPVHLLEGGEFTKPTCDLYRRYVTVACRQAASQIRTLADVCSDWSIDLMLYPAHAPSVASTPRILPDIEYTLDMDAIGWHQSIVRELSSWDTFGPEWLQDHAGATTGRWLFAMQGDAAGIDTRQAMRWRLDARNGDLPLESARPPIGVGYWSTKVYEDASDPYLLGIKEALT